MRTFREMILTSCFPEATRASTMVRPTLPVPPATATIVMLSVLWDCYLGLGLNWTLGRSVRVCECVNLMVEAEEIPGPLGRIYAPRCRHSCPYPFHLLDLHDAWRAWLCKRYHKSAGCKLVPGGLVRHLISAPLRPISQHRQTLCPSLRSGTNLHPATNYAAVCILL